MFYVSHSAGSVKKMCDRAIVLDKGKVGFDGDVDEAIKYLHYDGDDEEPDAEEERRGRARRRARQRHLRRAATPGTSVAWARPGRASPTAEERGRDGRVETPRATHFRAFVQGFGENYTACNGVSAGNYSVCSYSETLP